MPRFYSILPGLKNRKKIRFSFNEEEYFVRCDLRLHSYYFSRQNIETTVVDQGMLKMLFKGILPLGNLMNDISTSDYMQPFSKCQM